jgi:hypothetical protein
MVMPDPMARVDKDKPALARIYDFVLGGGYNFAADREVAKQILDLVPAYQDFALENRAFLRRAALHMLDAGIQQFLDLGSGLLSVGPSHQIVQGVNPECRVVYVDNDPVVTANVELSVGDDPRVGVVWADMCDVRNVLGHPNSVRVLDLRQPVGVLAIAVLHCIPDANNPKQVLTEYHDRLAPGSMLAATHGNAMGVRPERAAAGMKVLAEAGITYVNRTQAEVADMFGPWQPTSEGMVPTNLWRPEATPNPRTNVLSYAIMTTSTR